MPSNVTNTIIDLANAQLKNPELQDADGNTIVKVAVGGRIVLYDDSVNAAFKIVLDGTGLKVTDPDEVTTYFFLDNAGTVLIEQQFTGDTIKFRTSIVDTNNNQILEVQQPPVADASGASLANTTAQLNALLAALRIHGLIAT